MPEQSAHPKKLLNTLNKSNYQSKEKWIMKTVRMLDDHEEIIGLSGHLLAVSRKAITE